MIRKPLLLLKKSFSPLNMPKFTRMSSFMVAKSPPLFQFQKQKWQILPGRLTKVNIESATQSH